jgi:hypothetical protein
MTAIAIVGAPLAIGSFIVDEEIAKTGCGGKDAHNYATGIMILSLVMCIVSVAFLVCKKKCNCEGVDLDKSVYIGGGIVLSTILLYLSISLAKKIDFAKCTTAGNIVWFLVGSSATALMICLGMAGMAGYNIYIKNKDTEDVKETASQSSRRSSEDSIQVEEPSSIPFVSPSLSRRSSQESIEVEEPSSIPFVSPSLSRRSSQDSIQVEEPSSIPFVSPSLSRRSSQESIEVEEPSSIPSPPRSQSSSQSPRSTRRRGSSTSATPFVPSQPPRSTQPRGSSLNAFATPFVPSQPPRSTQPRGSSLNASATPFVPSQPSTRRGSSTSATPFVPSQPRRSTQPRGSSTSATPFVPSQPPPTQSIANTIQPPQLPPWKIYSDSPRSTMWQRGAKRVHLEIFDDWYNSLNPATRRQYLTQSSVPPLWRDYYKKYTLID